MGRAFDYSKEPRSDIAFVDMKSFTRVWNVWQRGLHCWRRRGVMSRADNSQRVDFSVLTDVQRRLWETVVPTSCL